MEIKLVAKASFLFLAHPSLYAPCSLFFSPRSFSCLLYFLSLIPLHMTDAVALGTLSFERVYQNRNPWWFPLLHPQRESLSRATDSSLDFSVRTFTSSPLNTEVVLELYFINEVHHMHTNTSRFSYCCMSLHSSPSTLWCEPLMQIKALFSDAWSGACRAPIAAWIVFFSPYLCLFVTADLDFDPSFIIWMF